MATAHRQLYLAAYDIRDDRRRVGALKMLRGYATGGQKSVHEVWLTEAEKRTVLGDMVYLLNDETDRFFLLRLDPRSRTLLIGRAVAPADPDYFYIG
jgi:CRISPR-associated protein Cas2